MLKKIKICLMVILAMVLTMGVRSAVAEGNHYKCYPVLDWVDWEPKTVTLEDQFGKSQATVVVPKLLCNPVDKNGEGIVDKNNHLVCYGIRDEPVANVDLVEEVYIENQFGGMSMWVGVPGSTLCLPSSKKHIRN